MQRNPECPLVRKLSRRRRWFVAIAGFVGLLSLWHFVLRSSLQPFDSETETSIVKFSWTGTVKKQVGGFRETTDGAVPGISNVTRQAASGFGLYSARMLERTWVFWWDSRGNPQLIVRTEPPSKNGVTPKYLQSNLNEMYVIVPRFGLPLEVATFRSAGLQSQRERVVWFIQRASTRKLSDDQVGQILEMLDLLGTIDDPVVLEFLKSVVFGKFTLSHCQEQGGSDPGFTEQKIGGSANLFLPLRQGAASILGRSIMATDDVTASLLESPSTAIWVYRGLEDRSQLPADLSQHLGRAFDQATPAQALEIVAILKLHDAPAAGDLCMHLMQNGDKAIRDKCFNQQLDAFIRGGAEPKTADDRKLYEYIDSEKAIAEFSKISDPRIKAHWQQTLMPAIKRHSKNIR